MKFSELNWNKTKVLIVVLIIITSVEVTRLRLDCEALRFTVDTVALTIAELTVRGDLDVHSIILLRGNLQQQDIYIMSFCLDTQSIL